ncbi:Xenotropic and polytropic retrovirus receptor 1 [Tilletia horrida]|uniref:Xenotropic and polytropic retrovirus receptor 1 n=1 Tax=Tilletia horrida TaxID=155126 RepID=A0AAN6JJY4_9BASI|nr:Xenotropic and polytropic retrovirus receptor 1 [Tilletia horrida]
MKFARYLEDASVPEWRRSYVNYGGIKKLIRRVAEHRRQRLNLELAKTVSRNSGKTTPTVLGSATSALRRRRSSNAQPGASGFFVHQAPTYGAAGTESQRNGVDLEANFTLEPISLEGTGLHLLDEAQLGLYSDEQAAAKRSEPSGSNGHQHAGTASQSEGPLPKASVSAVTPASESVLTPHEPSEGTAYEPLGTAGTGTEHETIPKVTRFDAPEELAGESSGVARPGMGTRTSSVKTLRLRSVQAASQLVSKLKTKSSYPENLSQIIEENFDDEEAKIFLALESEMHRVIQFLEAREKQALDRFEVLAVQLQELARHRLEFKARTQGTGAGTGRRVGADAFNIAAVSTRIPKFSTVASALPARVLSSLDPKRTSVGGDAAGERRGSGTSATPVLCDPSQPGYWDEGAERRSKALSRIPHFTAGNLFTAADEELRKANEAAALSHEPERYRNAKKKMKVAVLEEYRLLELIRDFRILNRTALAKSLKKLQKQTGVHCSDAFFKARVAPTMLVKSERIEQLIKSTEELYTYFFEHGDRKKARERLRAGNAFATLGSTIPHQSHHISVFKAGLCIGVALCATAGGLVKVHDPATRAEIPQWEALLRVYGALFLPAMFAFLFGLNLAAWRRTRVNYVFIFEFDVRTLADYHQYFELPALFLLLLSICFWVSFLNPFPTQIAPTTWPLVWIVTVVVILVAPVPFFLHPSRRWIVRSLLRVFQAGILSRVEFRDFFLGDELNSLVWTFATLWFIGCQYQRNWPAVNTCEPNSTFWTPVLGALPPFIRFIQCWRRWIDSDMKARIHLINAGKYTTSILNQFFYFNYRYHGSSRTVDLVIWCWSLLNPRARWPFLRDDLYYEWPILYYFAIVSNVIIRFGWVIYLFPGSASVLLRTFIVALLEALRRWQWNMYRLENEHLGNADDFRVVKDVPLPYTHGMRAAEEDLDDDDVQMAKKRRNIFKLSETYKAKDKDKDRDREAGSSDGHSDPFAAERMPPMADGEDLSERVHSALGLGPEQASTSSGKGIDDQVGAKGSSGRDYEPHQGGPALGS